jgi:O-antigen/teichoic acid export membrane protein
VLVPRVLAGHGGLFAAVLLGAVTSLLVYLARGLLGGLRMFGGYAATLGVEGLARLVPCLVIAAADAPGVVWFAVVFAAGSAFGSLAGVPAVRHLDYAGPPAEGSVVGLARAVVTLAGATLLLQVVANLAPVVVTARSLGDAAPAAAFAAAFVLVRIPILLLAPVQAMLLPNLTAAAATQRWPEMRRLLRLGLLAVAALGVPTVVVAWTAGPWAVRVLFGARVDLPGWVLATLAVSTVAITVTQILQPALIAVGRHRAVAMSWLLGAVLLVVLLALPGDPIHAAVAAQLAASLLAVAGMVLSLPAVLRRRTAGPPSAPLR